MFKAKVTTETDRSTENFTRTFKTQDALDAFKAQLRTNAPAGSTATVKVTRS